MRDEDMDRENLAAWLRLLITPGLGPAKQRRLLAAFGLPRKVFAAPYAALAGEAGPFSQGQLGALRRPPAGLDALVEATQAWLDEGISPQGRTRRVITLADTDYPPALLEAEDPPLLLYAQGLPLANGPLVWPPTLAVVGSRNATPQGVANARAFSRHLAAQGWTVISGLALGIDGAAHEGAIAGAADRTSSWAHGISERPHQDASAPQAASLATVAVVGTGLDRVYPTQHEGLAHHIAQQGLLLSEFPLGTPPLRENFPRRNRIIAAIARGTLVVEAAPQSGSLITARLAAELGREVFAIPGSIHAPQSRGCHALIRQGAKLVETAQDVLEELGWAAPPPPAGTAPRPRSRPQPRSPTRSEADGRDARPLATASANRAATCVDLGADIAANTGAAVDGAADKAPALPAEEAQDPVLLALGGEAVGLDALLDRTGRPAAWLQARLLALELDGQLSRLPGGLFQRVSGA
jgi:DNA processing protein